MLAEHVDNNSQITGIRILGYTDRIGTDEYNMILSKKRADAVRNQITNRLNISEDKIEVVAMGKKNPRVTCEGVHGKKLLIDCLGHNRRVEVFLTLDKVLADN